MLVILLPLLLFRVHFIATKVKIFRFFRIRKPPRFCNFNFFTKRCHLESSKIRRLNESIFGSCTQRNSVYDFLPNIYLFKFNSRNTRKRCEIFSKLTIKTPERCQWRRSGVFIVNFEHISHLFLVFLLLTLNNNCLRVKSCWLSSVIWSGSFKSCPPFYILFSWDFSN